MEICGSLRLTSQLVYVSAKPVSVSETSLVCLGLNRIPVVKFCGHRLRFNSLKGCRRHHHALNGFSLTRKIQLIDFTTDTMNLPLMLVPRKTTLRPDKYANVTKLKYRSNFSKQRYLQITPVDDLIKTWIARARAVSHQAK